MSSVEDLLVVLRAAGATEISLSVSYRGAAKAPRLVRASAVVAGRTVSAEGSKPTSALNKLRRPLGTVQSATNPAYHGNGWPSEDPLLSLIPPGPLERLVMDALTHLGSGTDVEIGEACVKLGLGISPQTAQKRREGLVNKGLVYQVGMKINPSGVKAKCWALKLPEPVQLELEAS